MTLPSKRDKPRTTGKRGDWDITADAPADKPKAGPKPRKPLPRGKGIERGEGPKRTTKLSQVSDKTKARRGERDAVRQHRCALAHLGGCAGPIDTHEIVRRSQMSEAAYMADVIIGLCRRHHGEDEFRLTAERVGIRVPRWVYDQDPVRSVAEAARLRTIAARPRVAASEPYWWSDEDRLRWETNAEGRKRPIFA